MGEVTAESGRRLARLDRLALAAFAIALLASAALLLHYKLRLGLFADDLVFLDQRGIGGIDTLLEPHGENIVVLQAALYRLIFMVFGFGSAVPFQVISLSAYLLSVVALFIWVRGRVGYPIAAVATIPVLVLGTAYYDLLWAFQVGYSVSVLAGLIALIALDRQGRLSSPVACLALIAAVTMSSLGLPFLVAAAVLLWRRDGWSFWRRYEIIVPLVIFLAWYIGWGRHASSQLSLTNVLDAPVFVVESIKSVVMSLTGLHRLSSPAGDVIGWLMTVAVVGLTALGLIRRRTLPDAFLIAVAAGLTFWVLISFSQIEGSELRSPTQSRYQYPGAVFLIMILAGAFSGVRPGRPWLAGLGTLAAVSVACSLVPISDGWKFFNLGAVYPKAAMTAFNVAGDKADPAFGIPIAPFLTTDSIPRDKFLVLQDRYGKGGWSADEIPKEEDFNRRAIDHYAVSVLGIEIRNEKGSAMSCRKVELEADRKLVETLTSGEVSFAPENSQLIVKAGRFADEPSVELGEIAAGSTGMLSVPRDQSTVPWRVAAEGEGTVRVCRSQPNG